MQAEERKDGGETATRTGPAKLRRRNLEEAEREIRRLKKENAGLNRFRNGTLWSSAYAAGVLSPTVLARIGWNPLGLVLGLALAAYVLLFVIANWRERE